ncbi:MAG: UDP-N-acetylmuramate--L-alanine ligase [Gammaproteobacteria bacterium]|jgi:UDP-N-acetylmuramate--alanine ligase|nr:UDP-N-acetylmuramate--L-alanine ligase [Gammaproteobacteria bacterium]MBT3725549.1 UDP-N-acetylmuramate--L-alanine ligase [Gammaproteobacteria bacterium]MBT4077056.1 UDP-N-acetylmuramate--L-alanine ligase [Gammaproteobacteria bacterium]MBT4193335.1 UDP-N-acetylmuramate--L-alanine ligase [Gammaproteobacteria bacterium]MBT4449155.1 UDP-N-acetylmuramate--L-alanine ligase [Gammaproteobacteria bacterium]
MTRSPRQLMRRIKNIHFVGIGGAGMSGIAEVFHNLGYKVTGSDINDSQMVKHLGELGIDINIGHQSDNIIGTHVVVVSTAIDESNPEIVYARELRIPIVRRAEMLAELMRFRQGIAVAGTHGKTTTTSLVTAVLAEGGLDPTYVIGGKLNSSGRHAKLGDSDYLVAEADESDASFLYLQPVIAIVTNIDQDHLSTYEGDFDRLKHTFVEFLHHLPFYGLAVLCIDDDVVREILPQLSRPILTYGEAEDADVRITEIKADSSRTHYSVTFPDSSSVDIELNMAGKHNVLNATAALAVGWELEVTKQEMQNSLSQFEGIGRRFQITEQLHFNGKTIRHIDDYGHHPNEIKATVEAIRAAWPEQRLTVVFQPHRYSRTRDLFEDFSSVLSEVDQLVLLEVYPAGEKHIKDADGRALSRSIRNRGRIDPVFVESITDLKPVLTSVVEDSDILLTLGAGSIGAFAADFLQQLKADSAG